MSVSCDEPRDKFPSVLDIRHRFARRLPRFSTSYKTIPLTENNLAPHASASDRLRAWYRICIKAMTCVARCRIDESPKPARLPKSEEDVS